MNPTEEYNAEMTAAKVQTDAYLASAKENVDENTVIQLDAVGASAGKVLFAKTCVPCHLAEGQGLVGPNLTDDFWIHGGGIKDIFKTIRNTTHRFCSRSCFYQTIFYNFSYFTVVRCRTSG